MPVYRFDVTAKAKFWNIIAASVIRKLEFVVPLIDGDLAENFLSIGAPLQPLQVSLHPASAVCVVMVSQGYPDACTKQGKKSSGSTP